MRKILIFVNRASRMPLKQVLPQLAIILRRNAKNIFSKNKGRVFGTYINTLSNLHLRSYFPSLTEELYKFSSEDREQILHLSSLYCKHYFDILGSGWVRVRYGMECLGVEGYRYDMSREIDADGKGEWLTGRINRSNLQESRRIWGNIDDENYKPIDWQLDFKSGYRWTEKNWHKDIRYGHKPGVDVKVPWELARMQHLPMLAWAYGIAGKESSGFASPETYAGEFRNQVLDFIALNPPGFGVNWFCTMDVAIRAVNWLVTYDLFTAFGAEFDEDFMAVFARSIYEHGKHCIENLEYSTILRSNHYLSDIAGLFFTAAYLPSDKKTSLWLAFAIQEMTTAMKSQFHRDGSNFEASTSYHRLSTEIMLYCSMLCLNLSGDKREALKNYCKHIKSFPVLRLYRRREYNIKDPWIFPHWYWTRLAKAVEFTKDIIKPSGEISQIGDNDSGRFLKIWSVYDKLSVNEASGRYQNLENYSELSGDAFYLDENILDHRHIPMIGSILFGQNSVVSAFANRTPEAILVEKWLSRNKSMDLSNQWVTEEMAGGKTVSSGNSIKEWREKLFYQYGNPFVTVFEGYNLTEGMEIYTYPDFGVFLYKSKALYLSIRCGCIGQNGNGGHSHNDQLSIELSINGQDLIKDPGTYLYTPIPEKRNYFRSTKVHFTPFAGDGEQNHFDSLFSIRKKSEPEVLFFNEEAFLGQLHIAGGETIFRLIRVSACKIEIQDFFKGEAAKYENHLYSNGYGKLLKTSK